MMNTTKVIGGLIGVGATVTLGAVTHKLRKNPDNAEEQNTTTVRSVVHRCQ